MFGSKMDLFVKSEEGTTVKTNSGAMLSITCLVMMVVLLYSELITLFTTTTHNQMVVDQKFDSDQITIDLNVTFYEILCDKIHLDLKNVKQVGEHNLDESLVETPYKGANGRVTGCTCAAQLTIDKVKGSLHFAMGSKGQMLNLGDYLSLNVSHHIHSLSFGERFPGQQNALDNAKNHLDSGTGQYSYFISVVPVEYQPLYDDSTMSNHYAVTEHLVMVDLLRGRMPETGIFFYYDFSPIMEIRTERRPSFLRFFTNVCAILGGVFTVFGMMDGMVSNASKIVEGYDKKS